MSGVPEISNAGMATWRVGARRLTANLGGLWRFCKRKPLGAVSLGLLLAFGFLAAAGPWVAPQDPLQIHGTQLFHRPQWTHGFILGSDELGRDVLSRLIIGTRVSLMIAVSGVLLGGLVGMALGLVSGYFLGWVDAWLQRLTDIQMSFPGIVQALMIVTVFGQARLSIIVAIAFIQVAAHTRVIRSVVIGVREAEYVQAARLLGASPLRILLRHIAPQTFAPAIVLTTASLGLAVLTEASLSFLGLGTRPPNPSWGSMLAGPTLQNVERAPWNAVWPGLVLSLLVFSFNLFGDALRDVLDPRLRR